MKFVGVLVQGEFKSESVAVDLHVVVENRGSRGARGRMRVPKEVGVHLLRHPDRGMFEFRENGGEVFNLFVRRFQSGPSDEMFAGVADVLSSGKVPGLLE